MPQLMPQRVPQQYSGDIMGFDTASSGYASL
jgi:hypothetical protein